MSENRARGILYRRSERMCERCAARRATNAHHRRRPGRIWTPENLLHLCGSGVTGCHGWIGGHSDLARMFGWAVAADWDPRWTPVLVWRRWVYLTPAGGKVPVRDLSGLPAVELGFPEMALPRRRGEVERGS